LLQKKGKGTGRIRGVPEIRFMGESIVLPGRGSGHGRGQSYPERENRRKGGEARLREESLISLVDRRGKRRGAGYILPRKEAVRGPP